MRVTRGLATWLAALVVLLVGAGTAPAAVVRDAQLLLDRTGVAVHQQFRADGASVVTTGAARACVVSRRIEIETARYLDRQGRPVDFADILRSPASSVQAIATGPDDLRFRVQMKYSPLRDSPVTLSLGDDTLDVRAMLEPSTDSLLLTGAVAARLDAAFRDGIAVGLSATSQDTAHAVHDRLAAPDMGALRACLEDLALSSPTRPVPGTVPRLTFDADPATTPLATLPQMRACRMQDAPGVLHLATLGSVEGFFSPTDQVFVSFNPDGTLARVYIPGIFDADFAQGRQTARLSRAADGNVPTETNGVKGCLGAAEVRMCSIGREPGRHRIGPCTDDALSSSLGDATGFVPGPGLSADPVATGPVAARRAPTPTPTFDPGQAVSGPGLPRSPVGGTGMGRPQRPEGDGNAGRVPLLTFPVVVPASVPLPASLPLLVAGVLSILGLRARGRRAAPSA